MSSSAKSPRGDSGDSWTGSNEWQSPIGDGRLSPSRWQHYRNKARLLFVYAACLVLLVLARPAPVPFAAGLLLVVAGEALRVWSSGFLCKQEALSVTGPYSHSRNPLYVGTAVMLVGFCLLSGLWWSLLVVLPLFFLVYLPTVRAEEDFLRRRFGEAYEEYCRRVPRWGWRGRGDTPVVGVEFTWPQVHRNREWDTVALLAAIVALFALRFWWP